MGPVLLTVLGLVLAAGAGLWWWTSQPSDAELRTEEVSCALRRQFDANAFCSDPPAPAVAGPVVLAIIGGFVALCGVILVSGRRR